MKRYNYLSLGYGDSAITFKCTDSSTLEWAITEVKKFVPTCEIHEADQTIAGETVSYRITRLDNKDHKIGNWLLQKFCQQGWEPFLVDDEGHAFHFRFEVEY